MDLSESFWDHRYKNEETAWDLGKVSPPLKAYFDQLTNRNLKILIPGGGNSHEAEYLHNNGFDNVYVADLSKTALNNIKLRVSTFNSEHLIHTNFFDLDLTFDLIIEQTFFCAINPKLRTSYVEKAFQLLEKKGKITGLLFDEPFTNDKPPFGGSKMEYVEYFEPYFHIQIMEEAHNSVDSRVNRELFFKMTKKNLD